MITEAPYHHIFEQISGYIGWKDQNFRHLGCNRNLAKILKLKDVQQILGLSDDDLLGSSEALSTFHRENDKIALSGKTVKAIHQAASPYDSSFFYFIKKPLLDNKNNITGLIYHCQEFASKLLHNLANTDRNYFAAHTMPTHYHLVANNNPFKLAMRELEVLFFLLRGKTAKEIAEIIGLSKRTIESYIEQIKSKFGCNTKTDLLLLAVVNGYMNIIPPRLLQTEVHAVIS
jgi:DNA-binding CsgD family transcriptional regulator